MNITKNAAMPRFLLLVITSTHNVFLTQKFAFSTASTGIVAY